MVILGANLGHRLHPLQNYKYKETNTEKIGLDIVMDYIKVVGKQIFIEIFVSRTKWKMQSGVKSGANTLYVIGNQTDYLLTMPNTTKQGPVMVPEKYISKL